MIEAILTLVTSGLNFLTEHEKNNPTWLKKKEEVLKLEKEYNEEFNKGHGSRNQYKLDRIRDELCLYAKPVAEAFDRISSTK